MSDAPARTRRSDLLLLSALGLLAFAASAAGTPLFDLDEGAFSQATLELLQSGDWLTTRLNGEPRYDKPILAYWLQAISVSLLGVTELAFRLPSILAASAWVFAVYFFGLRVLANADAALFAAASLALAPMVGVIGHAATADALLNLFLALALLDLYRHWLAPCRALRLRVFLWMGLGFLTKGPVALALPILVSLAFYGLRGQWRDWLKAAFDPFGWAVLAGVIGLWLVPLLASGHGEFLWRFFVDHNLGRFAQAAEGHRGPVWYYVLALPLVVLPFTALLPRAFASLRGWRDDPLALYCGLWFAIVFVIISLAATKLPHYLLYGCTPLFLLFGRAHARLPKPAWTLAPAAFFVGLLATLPWLLALPPETRAYERGIAELAIEAYGPVEIALGIVAVIAVATLFGLQRIATWRRLLAAGVIQAALVWTVVMPVFAKAQQAPVREAGHLAKALGGPAVSYRTFLPSFSVYRGAITPNRAPQPGELVFLRRDRIAALRDALPGESFETLYERGGVALLRRPPGLTTAPAIPDRAAPR